MASNSKVFVSPGVYTSEVDLSFVAQSVGVTTLGIVGETVKGPAFEPIFITSYDEFSTYFGGTNPEKFVNTQIPKYEAAYIAKAYLQQSNQLFVTRILGLSGYDAGPSWSISTVANVDVNTVGFNCFSSVTSACTTTCVEFETYTYSVDFTGNNQSVTAVTFTENFPSYLQNDLTTQYENFNGTTSSISSDLKTQIFNILTGDESSSYSIDYFGVIDGTDYNSLSAYTASTNVFNLDSVSSTNADYTDSNNDPWYYAQFDNNGNGTYSGYSFYSTVSGVSQTSTSSNCATFSSYSVSGASVSLTSGSINYNTNTITVCVNSATTTNQLSALTVTFSACTTGVTVGGVLQYSTGSTQNFTAGTKTYVLTSNDLTETATWTVNVVIDDPCNPCSTGNTGNGNVGTVTVNYSGSVNGKIYIYSGTPYLDYDDLVIATLRSRGVANYSTDNGAVYQVTGTTGMTLDFTGSYSGVSKNPFSTFGVNVTDKNGTSLFFESSFTLSDVNYISKVFGTSNFSKPRTTVPLFVEETFQTLLTYGYRKGYIRGLSSSLTYLPDARQGVDSTSIAWYLEKYQSPTSPWVVSELRGNKVYELFKFTTIADGDAANSEVKISIANISFSNGTFDVLVRDFFDTDDAPVVLEKFTNCATIKCIFKACIMKPTLSIKI